MSHWRRMNSNFPILPLSVPISAGPPVNVTCNIFINSFGSIAETTMVSSIILNITLWKQLDVYFNIIYSSLVCMCVCVCGWLGS